MGPMDGKSNGKAPKNLFFKREGAENNTTNAHEFHGRLLYEGNVWDVVLIMAFMDMICH